MRSIDPETRVKLMKACDLFGVIATSKENVTPEIKHFLNWVERIPAGSFLLLDKPVLLAICCMESRADADKELSSLTALSAFFTIQVLTDPTEMEVMEKLREIQSWQCLSAMVVVVMAHGSKGCIQVRDKATVLLQDIYLQMCPRFLAHIPKVCVVPHMFILPILVFFCWTESSVPTCT